MSFQCYCTAKTQVTGGGGGGRLVQWQWVTLSSNRGVTVSFHFLRLHQQDSMKDNELRHKKSHRRAGWVWSISCRYGVSKQATLNQQEKSPQQRAKWHISQEILRLLDSGFILTIKYTRMKPQLPSGSRLQKLLTPHLVLRSQKNTVQLKSNVNQKQKSKLALHTGTVAQRRPQKLHKGTRKQWWWLPRIHN